MVLVAEGLSNQKIATTLFLSFQTVRSYVPQIFDTLDIANRVHAANYVHRNGG